MHAEHALMQGTVLRNGAFAEQCVDDRRLQLFRQPQHSGTRAGDDRAMPDVQHGFL